MSIQLRRNPFRPGHPITDPEYFAGRRNELHTLVDALYQTGNGNARNMNITGARGVGKSSLANQIDELATNNENVLAELGIDANEFDFNFLIIKYKVNKNSTIENMLSIILNRITKSVDSTDSIRKFISRWDFSVNIGPISAEYQKSQGISGNDVILDFIESINSIYENIMKSYSGIIMAIDEFDTVSNKEDFALFCKLFTEYLNDRDMGKMALYLIGISGFMGNLAEHHPSIRRIFDTIEVMPMTDEEINELINRTLNTTEVIFDEEVVDTIIRLSSGYPSPVHLLSYYAFEADRDGIVNMEDFEKGLDKVISQTKREELDEKFMKAGSGDYRKILLAMASSDNEEVELSEVAGKISRKSSDLSSYMSKLVERELVEKVDRAVYKISDPILRVYIRKLKILNQESIDPQDLGEADEIEGLDDQEI